MSKDYLILKAYEAYLEALSTNERIKQFNEFGVKLDQFHQKLKGWKSTDSVDFIVEFALSKDAEIFAAAGQGRSAIEGFREFMSLPRVKEDLEKLIFYKFNYKDNIDKHNEIQKHDIRKYLEENNFEFNKPKHLIGRLLLMIFPELYTTIADEKTLEDVCNKLDVDMVKNTRYLAKHRIIRWKIDKCLKENNLYEELNNITKTGLAWWITRA